MYTDRALRCVNRWIDDFTQPKRKACVWYSDAPHSAKLDGFIWLATPHQARCKNAM